MPGTARNEAVTETKKQSRTVIIVAAILAAMVVALTGIIIFLLNRGNVNANADAGTDTPRKVASSVRTVLDEDSAKNVMDQMREEVREGMFECQMSMTWTFADGKAASKDAYIANSTNNTHPICFDVYMQDTEELLYSSPVLPVGTDIRNIKLDKELAAGKYQATVMYKLLSDVDSQEEISSAGFVVTINVLN